LWVIQGILHQIKTKCGKICKYNMKMKQIDYQASQLIALQVGARLGLLASLVGMCDEVIKMGYVDSSPPPFKFILETSISCMVYKNV
jgi:hypothetical protein